MCTWRSRHVVRIPVLNTRQITLNGQDFSNSSTVRFRYFQEPLVFNFFPRGGPIQGATMITFKGFGLERLNDGSLLVRALGRSER